MAHEDKAKQEDWLKTRYTEKLVDLPADTRTLLETYSKIPSDEIEAHCTTIRDKAWAIHPYPCIGQWRFLELSIGMHPLYPEILSRMRDDGQRTYLDLGCAFAQDIRRLVADGVDSGRTFGSDLRLDFIELGYELFNDRATLKTEFIAADIFDSRSPLQGLEGKLDIIGASSFFHLFNREDQKKVGVRVAKLLKPEPGSLLVGRQVGQENPAEQLRSQSGGSAYQHNVESWQKLWREIGEEVGANFEVVGKTGPIPRNETPPGKHLLTFSVRRL